MAIWNHYETVARVREVVSVVSGCATIRETLGLVTGYRMNESYAKSYKNQEMRLRSLADTETAE